MASPTSLPIARLRAAGCKVSTTVSHNGHDPKARSPFWEYVVTLPNSDRIGTHDVLRFTFEKATLRGTVRPNVVVVYSYDVDSIAGLLAHLASALDPQN